jgi:small-conductance mechanosensitive channel
MSFFNRMNPTVRGLAIVALVALVVVVLQLQSTLLALSMLVSIAFFLAIAYFIFLVWRERRSDIDAWSTRARAVFYGGALLIVLDLGHYFLNRNLNGLDALVFFLALGAGGYAMFRIWRDQHRYS